MQFLDKTEGGRRRLASRFRKKNLERFSRSFRQSKSGNVAIIFGLLIIPLVSMSGLAIDYTQAIRERARIQSALDSAALAAGRKFQITGDTDAAAAQAAAYFTSLTGLQLTTNTIDGSTFVLTVGGGRDVPTSFMGIMGHDYDFLTVSASAKAELKQGGGGENDGDDIEVSLMLDTTGSMGGSKMDDLKAAATDLVNIIVQDDQSEYKTRVALAPFARAVNVGEYFEAMTGVSAEETEAVYEYPESCYRTNRRGRRRLRRSCRENEDYMVTPASEGHETCVVERTGGHAFTDAVPGPGTYFGIFDEYTSTDCDPENSPIVPLSDDKQALADAIDDLPTSGMTAGHLGTAWAWYLLSPDWANVFPPENAPNATFTDTKKIAVLMSDGVYNQPYESSANGSSDHQADDLCVNMKASGIEVYAVGFDLSEGSSAYNTLRECATDDAHFFSAVDGEELRTAFRTIALKIATLRLVE